MAALAEANVGFLVTQAVFVYVTIVSQIQMQKAKDNWDFSYTSSMNVKKYISENVQ